MNHSFSWLFPDSFKIPWLFPEFLTFFQNSLTFPWLEKVVSFFQVFKVFQCPWVGTLYFWWLTAVALVVNLVFWPQNFGGDLWMPFVVLWKYSSTCRWWENLTTTCCNQSCFNFLQSRVVGIQKSNLDCPHTSSHLPLHPSHPLHLYLLPGGGDPMRGARGTRGVRVQGV